MSVLNVHTKAVHENELAFHQSATCIIIFVFVCFCFFKLQTGVKNSKYAVISMHLLLFLMSVSREFLATNTGPYVMYLYRSCIFKFLIHRLLPNAVQSYV